ncbi:MAG: hypothetical protein QG573_2196, partial [Acidobacteriota bacterium]|nr:hypothetical protein [Acidobacteriota bacterium]
MKTIARAPNPRAALVSACLLAALWTGVDPAGAGLVPIFLNDFETGSYGPWSNGGDSLPCLFPGDCLTGHCQNGFCCPSGDCCSVPGDCTGYVEDPFCFDAPACQGTRTDPLCGIQSICAGTVVDDDSGCTAATQALECGLYLPVACTGAQTQKPPSCPTSCLFDSDCVAAAHCDGTCVDDHAPGAACDEASDCSSDFCVDANCCQTACSGICQACDLAGNAGTCAPIPAGTDPDAECPAVSCSGYFWGWSGSSCHRRADVAATTAACDGASACQSVATECSASGQGPVAISCQPICQSPQAGTCAGTTPGACLNINPGTQTCGEGVCQVTVDQCAGGEPILCVPDWGAATAETCNGLDDDCDGTPDNSPAFADSLEPNGSCAEATTLAPVGSDDTSTYTTLNIYPSGDFDYFRIDAVEDDSVCGCGIAFL